MKEVKLYTCEYCDTKYSDKNDAIRCETAHKTCVRILNESYLPIKADGSGYPQRIEVIMSNGKSVQYERFYGEKWGVKDDWED